MHFIQFYNWPIKLRVLISAEHNNILTDWIYSTTVDVNSDLTIVEEPKYLTWTDTMECDLNWTDHNANPDIKNIVFQHYT